MLLLQRGARVNMLNDAKKTAAELASENGKAEVAKQLDQPPLVVCAWHHTWHPALNGLNL